MRLQGLFLVALGLLFAGHIQASEQAPPAQPKAQMVVVASGDPEDVEGDGELKLTLKVNGEIAECVVKAFPTECVMAYSEAILIQEIEIDAKQQGTRSNVTPEYYWPWRFALAAERQNPYRVTVWVSAASLTGPRKITQLYSVSPRNLDDVPLQQYYQEARAAWIVQRSRPRQPHATSGYSVIAAYVFANAAAELVKRIPSLMATDDSELKNALSFVGGLDDATIGEKLALPVGGQRTVLQIVSQVRASRAALLNQAWNLAKVKGERDRLVLFKDLLARYAEFRPADIHRRSEFDDILGVDEATIVDSIAEVLATLYRCQAIQKQQFLDESRPIIDRLNELIRRYETGLSPPLVADICDRARNVVPEPRHYKYCRSSRTLSDLREAQAISPIEPSRCRLTLVQ